MYKTLVTEVTYGSSGHSEVDGHAFSLVFVNKTQNPCTQPSIVNVNLLSGELNVRSGEYRSEISG